MTYYQLHHPSIGDLVQMHDSTYKAMNSIVSPKGQFLDSRLVENLFKVFEDLGWTVKTLEI